MSGLLPFAIVGCGGMGRRHLLGVHELATCRAAAGLPQLLDLKALVDVEPGRANALADEAQALLGARPAVFANLAELERSASCAAIDLNSGTETHHAAGIEALERGFDVLVEKPLTASIRTATRMIDTARRLGRTLGVAENLRREPVNRLARALVQGGIIGEVRFYLDAMFTGSDAIWLTTWRHMRVTGGVLLDVGVHAADLLEYLAGPAARVTGLLRRDEPVRRKPAQSPVASAALYSAWAGQLPAQFEGDAEDVAAGQVALQAGGAAQWTLHLAAHGKPRHIRTLFGSRGSIDMPIDRSGGELTLALNGRTLSGSEALALLPAYRLPAPEAAVWGAARIACYKGDFASTDRKLVAVELADFAEAVLTGRKPEVDGVAGRRSMALLFALAESALAGREVSVSEVECGDLHAYQDLFEHQLPASPSPAQPLVREANRT